MSTEYERKLIDMQYQMRENTSYLNDYMKDLDSWTDDIKKKEENLKKTSNSTSSTTKDLPPVRNFIEPPKPKKKSKKKNSTTQQPSSTISAYDYRSWDKYDVDAECEKVDSEPIKDDDESEGEEEEDDEDDEQWQEEVLKKKAEYYKDCGNYQFKQKSYAEAIEFYTKAIECNPTSPVYFANRAQCQLYEQRYGACEADCTLAIQLDNNFLKAYYRRALARVGLEKIDQARQDLEYVILREPSNTDAKNKLNEINKNDEIKRLGRIYPLHNKPVDKRSTKPLKRIEIQEIDTSIISTSETTKKTKVVIEEIDTVCSYFL